MIAIDQRANYQTNARELVLKLASRLDEGHICPRNQICRRIKGILAEKIKQGSITDRWIENSLPPDYKRSYHKSEVTSLSEREKNLLLADNCGKTTVDMDSPNGLNTESLSLQQLQPPSPKIHTAVQLGGGENSVTVYRDNFEEICFAQQNSNSYFSIIFRSGDNSFIRAEPDISENI